MNEPTHLDLFSGCGGFALAAERAGFRTVAHAEIEKAQSDVLRHHWPQVPNLGDVSTITGRCNGTLPSRPFLITGGFPCQDLSVAGRRAGLAGERSGLWFEYRRIIAELQPRWVVIENVPGLHSSNQGRDFAILIHGLVELGYCVAWRVLDAQYAGVAQRRERVFIVGSLGDGRCAQILFEPESLRWNPPPSRQAGQRTAATPGSRSARSSGVNPTGRGGEDDVNIVESPVVGALNDGAHSGGGSTVRTPTADAYLPSVAHAVTTHQAKGGDPTTDNYVAVEHGSFFDEAVPILEAGARTGRSTNDVGCGIGVGQQGDPMYALQSGKQHAVAIAENRPAHEIVGPIVTHQTPNGHGQAGVNNQAVQSGHILPVAFHTSGFGASEGPVAPTLQASDARLSNQISGIVSRMAVRRLTPRECERLQGFPDDHTRYGVDASGRRYELKDSPRYKMLGNAVAVPVVEWILRRIFATHEP